MTMTTILMVITEGHINDGVIVKIITIVIKNIKKRKTRRRIKYDKQIFPTNNANTLTTYTLIYPNQTQAQIHK